MRSEGQALGEDQCPRSLPWLPHVQMAPGSQKFESRPATTNKQTPESHQPRTQTDQQPPETITKGVHLQNRAEMRSHILPWWRFAFTTCHKAQSMHHLLIKPPTRPSADPSPASHQSPAGRSRNNKASKRWDQTEPRSRRCLHLLLPWHNVLIAGLCIPQTSPDCA